MSIESIHTPSNTHTPKNGKHQKKRETSKTICYISIWWFMVSSIASFVTWAIIAMHSSGEYSWIDCAVPTAMITTSGAICGVCLSGYFNMGRFVNVVKVKMHAYEDRLRLLNSYNILDAEVEKTKLSEAADDLDATFASEENSTTQEVENPLSII